MPCFEENGVRIALGAINRIANEQKKAIIPLLSIAKDFYLRVFVYVDGRKSACWSSMEKNGLIYYCTNCGNYHVEKFGHYDEAKNTYKPSKVTLPSIKCNICGGDWVINGPLYVDSLNDMNFVKRALANFDVIKDKDTTHPNHQYLDKVVITKQKEIKGLLNAILEEGDLKQYPISWDLTDLFGSVKVGAPKKTYI